MNNIIRVIYFFFPSWSVVWLQKRISILRKFLISKHSKGVLYHIPLKQKNKDYSYDLIVDSDDFGVGGSLAIRGWYDIQNIVNLLEYVKPSMSVLFVGAHVGSLVIPIAKKSKSCTAYEPNQYSFQLLEKNIKLANLDKKVTLHNHVVGEKLGNCEFYINNVNSGGSKIKPAKNLYDYQFDLKEVNKKKVVSIDQFEKKNYDFIIIDAEGSELLVLSGMKKKLVSCKFLQIEYNYKNYKNILGKKVKELNSQLLKLLSSFDFVIILGERKKYSQSEFSTLLDELKSKNQFKDLLFCKK